MQSGGKLDLLPVGDKGITVVGNVNNKKSINIHKMGSIRIVPAAPLR